MNRFCDIFHQVYESFLWGNLTLIVLQKLFNKFIREISGKVIETNTKLRRSGQ